MNTKEKGDLTQLMIMSKLAKLNKKLLMPYGDNQRYDLVIDENGRFVRIQCKSGRLNKAKNAIIFNVCSTYSHRGGKSKDYNGQVEFFGVYCSEIDKSYLIPIEDLNNVTSVANLRLIPSKNKQSKNIRLASRYEL